MTMHERESMENKEMKFIKSLVPYSTFAVVAGAIVLT